MCGFFFIKKKTSHKFNYEKLDYSANLIKHRGPDNNKIYKDKDIFIKFFRLSIQDLSNNAMQPMLSRSGRNIIVFNGEIYNFKFLKKLLNYKNLRSSSDTEVLLELYEQIGAKIFDKIKGMFSFVIYNLESKKIIVARDQFGIKPLYYYDCKDYIIFSSEIKPILNYNKNSKINNKYLAEFFFLGKQDHDNSSFFNKIYSVEPAHYYKFNITSIEKKRYWSILSESQKNFSKETSINKLHHMLNQTINNYLISDRKIGVFLSSGIDSTCLASIVSTKTEYKLDSFTYDFENDHGFGESEIAKINSKKIGIKSNIFKLSSKDVINNFDNMCQILESPFTSVRLFAVYELYKLAKLKKYNVIIEGAGGDELLGGYSYNYLPYLLDRHRSINKIINEILDFSIKSKKKTEIELINRLITLTFQGGSTTDSTPYININFFDKNFLNSFLNDPFYHVKNYRGMNKLQKSQILDIEQIKLPRNLKFTDRLSMSNSIETRLPLLDIDIAKYCFNLKNNFKIYLGQNKWIMKKVLKKIEKNIKFTKNKKTIADPQSNWLKNELKEYFIDNIRSTNFRNIGIFNHKYISDKFEKFINDKQPDTSFQFFQVLSSYRFIENFKK